MVAPESRGWERYVWLGGAVFVVALVAEFLVVAGVSLSLNDSEGKITAGLQDHHRRLILVACLSILYTPAFVIYLSRLHDLLREHTTHSRFLASWVLVGGVVWVTLHSVSDIGITGMVGAKIAVNAYTASHDHSGPTPGRRLVGRERELADPGSTIPSGRSRVVTLTGAGGTAAPRWSTPR